MRPKPIIENHLQLREQTGHRSASWLTLTERAESASQTSSGRTRNARCSLRSLRDCMRKPVRRWGVTSSWKDGWRMSSDPVEGLFEDAGGGQRHEAALRVRRVAGHDVEEWYKALERLAHSNSLCASHLSFRVSRDVQTLKYSKYVCTIQRQAYIRGIGVGKAFFGSNVAQVLLTTTSVYFVLSVQ